MNKHNLTSEIDVPYIANLARLELSEKEVNLFQSQLEQIVAYVQKINKLDLSEVQPTFQMVGLKNVFRADARLPGLDHQSVMENAPRSSEGQFLVPKIIE